MILTDTVVDVIKRELRRVSPNVKIEAAQIRAVLSAEVLKRDVLEGDKADEARKKINKTANNSLRALPSKEKPATEPAISLAQPVPADDCEN